jgi:hypothetical protein
MRLMDAKYVTLLSFPDLALLPFLKEENHQMEFDWTDSPAAVVAVTVSS